MRVDVLFELFNAGLAMRCAKGILKTQLSSDMRRISMEVISNLSEETNYEELLLQTVSL